MLVSMIRSSSPRIGADVAAVEERFVSCTSITSSQREIQGNAASGDR
jgi:hypothetical protein